MDARDFHLHLGRRAVWGGEEPLGLSPEDRLRHLFVVGSTGTGKTTLIKNICAQDIAAGRGLAFLDPHGDAAEGLLDLIRGDMADALIYFDPADLSFPLGFNVLTNVAPDDRHRVVAGVVGAFRNLFATSWGPRLEYVLANALMALLHCQNVTLLGLPRLLTEVSYRQWVLRQVDDPSVRRFFEEFDAWDSRYRAEVISPVQNKIGQLFLSPVSRNIFGQVRSAIDVRYIIDHRRVFIANLSRGRLGEDLSNLIGSLLVSEFQRAAMARAELAEHQRQDFALILDEFQNFSTAAFRSMFSELRKYRVSIIACTQYLDALSDEVRSAIFGNVANWMAFRVGQTDAAELSRQYGHDFAPQQFSNLPNFEVMARLLNDDQLQTPCHATTRLNPPKKHFRREKLKQQSQDRYGTPRNVVEERLRRWMR